MQTLIAVLILTGPFIGYWLAFRRADRSRLHVVVMSAIGAGFPMSVLCAAWALRGQSSLESVPWFLAALVYGAVIGLCGLLARAFGAWLSGRAR